ncbi:hypothetical protein SS50377_20312 [Spironucleus salmonicida]|uniref:RING-type domain-containing protein n=1 Tax=Spironucleus salmonicida TaxID=348837 RepID=V6LQF7_9EUKA|nr:hypothetical protein SS50377_20312 [Spironucleus salmonicida]|eukprot:EST42994.1 Hypothetical protein SS50377_17295 [Spironucleus salmonicida]
MEAKKLLDQVLDLQSSDSIYISETNSESYLTTLELSQSTSFFVLPQTSSFAIKFPQFDLWLANNFAIHNNILIDFKFPDNFTEILLLKLDEISHIIIRYNNIILLQFTTGKLDNFILNTISYGMLVSGQIFDKIANSQFSFLESLPSEATLIVLNSLFLVNEFEKAIVAVKHVEIDTLCAHLTYLRPQICPNFGIIFYECCRINNISLLYDYQNIIIETCVANIEFGCLEFVGEAGVEYFSQICDVSFVFKLFTLFPERQLVQQKFVKFVELLIAEGDFESIARIDFSLIQSIIYQLSCIQLEFFQKLIQLYFDDKFNQFKEQALYPFVLAGITNQVSLSARFLERFTQNLQLPIDKFQNIFCLFIQKKYTQLIKFIDIKGYIFYIFKNKQNVTIITNFAEIIPFLRPQNMFIYPDLYKNELLLTRCAQHSLNSSLPIDNPCPVCLNQISQLIILQCSHQLCQECLAQISDCPICRAEIVKFSYAGDIYENIEK